VPSIELKLFGNTLCLRAKGVLPTSGNGLCKLAQIGCGLVGLSPSERVNCICYILRSKKFLSDEG